MAIHKRYIGTHFRNLMGETYSSYERKGIHYTSKELSQLHHSQKKNGKANMWKVDEFGCQIGYYDKAIVYSTK